MLMTALAPVGIVYGSPLLSSLATMNRVALSPCFADLIQIRATPLMEDVPVYEMRENPDTGEKERVQVGTRQVVSGERERLMIIQDRCMKQCRQGASDFGLTVSSRCRLVVPKPQQQKPENKFAKYAN